MKKVIAAVTLILIVTLVVVFYFYDRPVVTMVTVETSDGIRVPGSIVNAYAFHRDDFKLVAQAITDENGEAEIQVPWIHQYLSSMRHINLSVKAFHEGMSVDVCNMTARRESYGKSILNLELNLLDDSQSNSEVRLRCVDDSRVTLKVPILELHQIEGVNTELTINGRLSSKISTYQIIDGQWRGSFLSMIVSDNLSEVIHSVDFTESCKLMTDYEFSYQSWILESKQDTGWEKTFEWEELIPVRHLGGIYAGPAVDGNNENLSDVENGDFGEHFVLGADLVRRTAESSYQDRYGIEFKDHTGAVSAIYDSGGISYEFQADEGYEIVAYDRNTDGMVWYYTPK